MEHVRIIEKRSYGISNFIGDVILSIVTAGLWLIWVFIREVRGLRHSC